MTGRAARFSTPLLRGAAAWRLYAWFLRDPVACLREAERTWGRLCAARCRLPFSSKERVQVLALGPEFNRQVLGDPARFRAIGQTIRGPRGSAQSRVRYGVARMRGPKHQKQRQLVTPPLQSRAIERACPRMVALSDEALSRWEVGATVDGWRELRRLSMRVASDILFARKDPERSYALGTLIAQWLARSNSTGVWMLPLDLPGTPYRALLRHAERLERELLAMLEEKRFADGQGSDVTSLLVRAYEEGQPWMTLKDLVGQAAFLFAASYETTACALTWTLFLLAQHPQVVSELADELEAVLRGAPPTVDRLGELVLLEAAIKEGMRLFPPAPFAIRAATGPARLRDLEIARGDRVVISHYITHHLPELYPAPERFLPRRWLSIKPGAYEYLPLSAGPRMCIGYAFAMTEMKVVLAMLLQRFRVSVLPGARIDRRVHTLMSPKYGIPLRVHGRHHRLEATPVRGDVREMVALT